MNKFNGKNIPVSVTVSTETEPTTVDGVYSQTADGFELKFEIGTDKFNIVHGGSQTTVKAEGVMSYDITLMDEPTETLLSTPFGKVMFKITTESRKADYSEDAVKVLLMYVLSADGVGDMVRSIELLIRS